MSKSPWPQTAPDRLEKEMLAEYPDLDAYISDCLAVDDFHWPEWCYLPMSASFTLVTHFKWVMPVVVGGSEKSRPRSSISLKNSCS